MQPLWKTVQQFLKMLSIQGPYDPANLLLGIFLREMKIIHLHKNLHTNVHSNIIHNSWKVETPWMSTSGWMDKQKVFIHTMEYYSAMKRNNTRIQATTWMNLENPILNEWDQSQKPHIVWFHLYEMSRINKSTETESSCRGCVGLGEEVGRNGG